MGHLAGLFWGTTKEKLPSIESFFIPRADGDSSLQPIAGEPRPQ
jgi:hypothetical protein